MDSRITRHDEGGKDNNAEAMITGNTEQIRQHNGYIGMENKTTSRRLNKTSSRNSKHGDSGQPQQSYGYKEANNKMF